MTDPPRRVLQGGRRRRRRMPPALPLVLVLGLVAWAALAVLDGSGKQSSRVSDVAPRESPVGRNEAAAASPRRSSRFRVNLDQADIVKLRFVRKPRAGLLFDVRTGRVLWRRNPERQLPIASLTKMMTALLVVERQDPHERVRITPRARHTAGSAVGVLPKRKR